MMWGVENLSQIGSGFFMVKMNTDVEIITPAVQARLSILEAKHEKEAAQLRRLESLAELMDAKFNIPFLPIPIGLDALVGLIPVVGDTISVGVSGTIVVGAQRLDVPKRHLTRMAGNMFIDWLIGLIPLVGDLFDIGWRGNIRNVKIAREQLERKWTRERDAAIRD